MEKKFIYGKDDFQEEVENLNFDNLLKDIKQTITEKPLVIMKEWIVYLLEDKRTKIIDQIEQIPALMGTIHEML